jgi:AraC family transcriptional regulator, regulatory protein of adaptative response / methylated-DNA-[protein]-cysteine methyltransferase
MEHQSQNYYRIEKAIRYLLDKAQSHPSLGDLATAINMSESHLQRTFSEWAGVSPKQFLQFLHSVSAKRLLRDYSVEETSGQLGYSSSSRLHDLLVNYEGITPGEVRSLGKGLTISWGVTLSPFGKCFIAQTDRGVCKVSFFASEEDYSNILLELKNEWPLASLVNDGGRAEAIALRLFGRFDALCTRQDQASFNVLARGTPFQLKVWEALLAIPIGQVVSYQGVANKLGEPSSVRAVASAIAKNPVAILIPCHRVIRSTGAISQYRWGASRKAALLLKELSDPA